MKFSTKKMVMIGVMAALSCVATMFLKVEIPTPLGKAMFHFGDVFCLSAAMMLGPVAGGLAGGIGMFFADIFMGWADSAVFTLVFKFIEGFVCGLIAYSFMRKGNKIGFNVVGAASGTVCYIALYLGKNFLEDYLFLQAELGTVMADISTKLINSATKGLVSVAVSVVLTTLLIKALKKNKIEF